LLLAGVKMHLLRAEPVIETIQQLSQRIEERFPESSLAVIGHELLKIGEKAQATTEYIERPILWVRTVNVVLLVLVAIGLVGTIVTFELPESGFHFFEFIQVLEAGINDVVLIGAGVFFLMTLEVRFKRKKALTALHELRSVAHRIDVLQLTKDPSKVVVATVVNTKSSPVQEYGAYELIRYLDYCSELLSLVGKIAALYGTHFEDSVALNAVNEIENLTTGLSRKIWQKLMILHMAPAGQGGTPESSVLAPHAAGL
jgi:hypothetical protein